VFVFHEARFAIVSKDCKRKHTFTSQAALISLESA
jgi:hypothetical protein